MEEKFLKVGEVANLLKVSVRQVHRLAKNGSIPEPVKIGSSSRWLLTQLMEKIANG